MHCQEQVPRALVLGTHLFGGVLFNPVRGGSTPIFSAVRSTSTLCARSRFLAHDDRFIAIARDLSKIEHLKTTGAEVLELDVTAS